MIKHVVMVLCVLLPSAGNAWAGAASAVVSGLQKSASGYTFKSPTATAANGAYNMSANVTSAGKQITMPATASFAANAGSYALTAVRLNPASLMIGLTAQWLIGQGLNYANNVWTKTQSAAGPMYWQRANSSSTFAAPGTVANLQAFYGANGDFSCMANGSTAAWGAYQIYPKADVGSCLAAALSTGIIVTRNPDNVLIGFSLRCSANGALAVPGGCPTQSTTVPASEADFTAAAAQPLTDGAATELVKVLDMPVNAPMLAPNSVDSFSAPYLDAVSGRQVKEMTRVTPDPLPDNPLNVNVNRYQVDAGAVPGQTAAPPAPTTQATKIDFPSDYARQGEAKTAADSINSTLGPKIDKITETGADPADPLQPQGSEFDQAFFQGTFTNLLGWQVPAHSSQCPTSGFTWNGQTYVMDSHCQLVTSHFSALAAVMAVVWTVIALFILLGA